MAHRRLKHENTYEIYKCPHCGTTRNSAHNFKTHLRTNHGIKMKNIDNFVKRIKKTAAGSLLNFFLEFIKISTRTDWNTIFIFAGIAAEKERKTVVRKLVQCDICELGLRGTFNLNRHKKNQHALGVFNWKKSLKQRFEQEIGRKNKS